MDYETFGKKLSELKLKKKIDFLGGRPEREIIINDDDISNLKIALETAKTLKQFLSLV